MAFEPSVEHISQLIKDRQKHENKNIIVAVGGPGGNGKTTLANLLRESLHDSAVIHIDDYRLPRSMRSKNQLGSNPTSNNIDLLASHLGMIQKNTSFTKPLYDTVSGTADETENYKPVSVNIIEGELSTINQLSPLYDLIIYMKFSLLKQLTYRVKRDMKDRKYSFLKSLHVFIRSNLIDYKIYNYKAKSLADIIVKRTS